MKKFAAAAVVLTLAGCASQPRPQLHVMPMHPLKPVAAPQPVAPSAPATFKQRWHFPKIMRHKVER